MNILGKVIVTIMLSITPLIAQENQTLSTQKEKLSYGIGVDTARNFKRLGFDLDVDALIKALRDVYSDGKLLMSEDEIKKAIYANQIELMKKQTQANKVLADKNKIAGDAFLAENRVKGGVVALPSGLQYRVIKPGEGKKPSENDTVEVHYKGMLMDGTEFDSSLERGQPALLPLKALIPGWREALQLMPVGSKWQLFIPSDLAYGIAGSGRDIEPNVTLIFEVELLAIK